MFCHGAAQLLPQVYCCLSCLLLQLSPTLTAILVCRKELQNVIDWALLLAFLLHQVYSLSGSIRLLGEAVLKKEGVNMVQRSRNWEQRSSLERYWVLDIRGGRLRHIPMIWWWQLRAWPSFWPPAATPATHRKWTPADIWRTTCSPEAVCLLC